MEYALIENGVVSRVGLPMIGTLKDGSTVSGYNLLDSSILFAEGWLPVVDEDMPTYDHATQYVQFADYEVQADKVIRHYTVVDIPAPQPQPPTTEDRLKAVEDAITALMGV